MRKKWTAAAMTTVFTLGLMPFSALAATNVSITDAKAGDNQITIAYEDAQAGDWYHLYRENNLVIHGALSESDAARGEKTLYHGDGTWHLKDQLRIEMRGDKTGSYVYDVHQVGDKIVSNTQGLQLSPKTLRHDAGTQFVTVNFKKGYLPENEDMLLITPLDKKGDPTGIAYQVEIERKGLNAVETRLRLTPNADIFKYRVNLMRGNQSIEQAYLEVTGHPKEDLFKDAVLKIDRTQGKVNSEEDFPFKVVNSKGEAIDASCDRIQVEVKNVTGGGALVIGDVVNQKDLKEGKGVLRLISNKATKADITLKFISNNNVIFTAKPFTFTFGEETPAPTPVAPTVVKMTIGSKDFVVNNEKVTTDVAPFIDQRRTFVPLRALMESFDANVYYDGSNKTITITADQDIVVMTIGNQRYSVNGTNKTMDVAPYIARGNRTMVPVRFAAEALGYKVDFKTDATGKHITYS